MEERTIIKGFLKSILGLEKAKIESIRPTPSVESLVPETVPPTTIPKTPKPKTEAYLNRRKGRAVHEGTLGYFPIIIDCIQRGGEVTPSQMVQELGLPKSTLIYNLNRLIEICSGQKGKNTHGVTKYVMEKLLPGKRLERVGGSKYVRYRIVEVQPEEPSSSSQ